MKKMTNDKMMVTKNPSIMSLM